MSNQPQETEINLRGVAEVAKAAGAVVLTAASPDDENSLDEPSEVAPVTQTIDNAAPTFRHVFPAHSVMVLRIKASRRLRVFVAVQIGATRTEWKTRHAGQKRGEVESSPLVCCGRF